MPGKCRKIYQHFPFSPSLPLLPFSPLVPSTVGRGTCYGVAINKGRLPLINSFTHSTTTRYVLRVHQLFASPFHIIRFTDAAIPSSSRSSSPSVSITTTLKTTLQCVWLAHHLTNLTNACSFLTPTTTMFDGHTRWRRWLIWHAGCSVASPIYVSGTTFFLIIVSSI